jgi:hypothetical protein
MTYFKLNYLYIYIRYRDNFLKITLNIIVYYFRDGFTYIEEIVFEKKKNLSSSIYLKILLFLFLYLV